MLAHSRPLFTEQTCLPQVLVSRHRSKWFFLLPNNDVFFSTTNNDVNCRGRCLTNITVQIYTITIALFTIILLEDQCLWLLCGIGDTSTVCVNNYCIIACYGDLFISDVHLLNCTSFCEL